MADIRAKPLGYTRTLPERKPVYSEKEAAEILQRAAKIQENAQEGAPYTPGVTEDELFRIATEAGIAPEFLQRALAGKTESERRETLLRYANEAIRVVEGELDPEDFDLVVEGLPRNFNNKMGQPLTQIGRQVSGTISLKGGHAQVEVKARRGRTRISVKTLGFFPLFGTIYPAFIGSAIAIAATAERGLVGVGLGIAAGLCITASAIAPIWLKALHREGEKLADDLASKTEEALGDTRTHAASATPVFADEEATTKVEDR